MQQSLILNVPVDYIDIPGGRDLFPYVDPPHILATEAGPGDDIAHSRPSDPCWDSMWTITMGALSAASNGAKALVHGTTSEDAQRQVSLPSILDHIAAATILNTGVKDFSIETPLLNRNHVDALRVVSSYGTPIPTWSCSWGALHHCGQCATCSTRKGRFISASIKDSTIYAQ